MQITLKQPGQPDRQLPAHEGQTILSFLANQGIHLDAPCAGRGHCGKCRVKVFEGVTAPTEAELDALSGDLSERLACQTCLIDETTVEIAAPARFSSVKGLGQSEPYDVDSPLKFVDYELLNRQDATDLMTARKIGRVSTYVLNDLAELDANRQTGRGIMWGDELLKVIPTDSEHGDTELLAAAVDLGTTGLAVAIIDVNKGEVVSQGTALNPQTAYGGDVISRTTAAAENGECLWDLQNLALKGISEMIKEAAGPERLGKIMAAVVTGNTTMMYLLAGIQPKGLAQFPFRPAFIKSLDLSHLAEKLGLDHRAKVLTAPCISAYVGGDITAGMLAVGLRHLPGTVLYIDIGTNGEIVLSHRGKLVATSCAAGPALEGMNILCGQRAIPGAVDSFAMTPDYQYKFSTIAETTPVTGICGSGLIDLTAALVDSKLIDRSGRLKSPDEIPDSAPWLKDLNGGRFNFSPPVFFDQKDVRQVQLAKGAIAAGVEMLLALQGLTEKDLDEIVIAGAFGFHLKPESLKSIRLIPPTYEGPVRFVGNSSLAGGARVILTPAAIDELNSIAEDTTVLELGADPKFQTIFVKHMRF